MKKRNLVLSILAAVLFLLLGLLLPWILSWAFGRIPDSRDIWRPENVLEYYGAMLTLAGTVVLGVVTFRQTRWANEQADRMYDRDKLRDYPDVSFENLQLDPMPVPRLIWMMRTGLRIALNNKGQLFYNKPEEGGDQLQPRKDLLLLMIRNNGRETVMITGVSVVGQEVRGKKVAGNCKPEVRPNSLSLSGRGEACLVIAGAGKEIKPADPAGPTDDEDQAFDTQQLESLMDEGAPPEKKDRVFLPPVPVDENAPPEEEKDDEDVPPPHMDEDAPPEKNDEMFLPQGELRLEVHMKNKYGRFTQQLLIPYSIEQDNQTGLNDRGRLVVKRVRLVYTPLRPEWELPAPEEK